MVTCAKTMLGSTKSVMTMRAALFERYGSCDVLKVDDGVPVPEPRSREVIVKIKAASVNPVDWRIRRGDLRMVLWGSFPRKLGYDLAGEVAAIGTGVTRWRVGEAVFGKLPFYRPGAYADFAVAAEDRFAAIPSTITFAEAAAAPLAAMTALQGLRFLPGFAEGGRIVSTKFRILIIGGSGGVGSYAVQLAKAYGAYVASSASTRNQAFLHSIGADASIDYTCQTLADFDTSFDLIFDAVGKQTFTACRPYLSKRGIYVTSVPTPNSMLWKGLTLVTAKKCSLVILKFYHEDLVTIKNYLERGTIRSYIDREFPLPKIAEAHRYAEQGHTVGKVIIAMN